MTQIVKDFHTRELNYNEDLVTEFVTKDTDLVDLMEHMSLD